MKKYTYDLWKYDADGKGRFGGLGATYLPHQTKFFNRFIEEYPDKTIFIIRKPDNKLMRFYHPLSSEV